MHLTDEFTDLVFAGSYKIFVYVPSKSLVNLAGVASIKAHLTYQVFDGLIVVVDVFKELTKV